jgi:hypothetical protein
MMNGVLELRRKSDAKIVAVDRETLTIEHFLGKKHAIAMSTLLSVTDKR